CSSVGNLTDVPTKRVRWDHHPFPGEEGTRQGVAQVRILHVTDRYSGGVGRAVDRITALVPEAEHHLLSSGVGSTDGGGSYAATAARADGVAGRVRAVRASFGVQPRDVVHAHSSWAGLYRRVLRLPVPVDYPPHCYWFERP